VVLYPNVASFADNRFDCCDLLQRSVIHHWTGKASGISSWYTGRIDRLQTICLKRRTSVFRRSRADSNARVKLEALGNAFMVKAVELEIKLQKLANDNSTASSPARARRYGQAAF
jgi:hypothetical protein